VQGGLVLALMGTCLMASAGSLTWRRGWLLLGLYEVCFLVSTSILVLKVPDLIDERRRKHANVKRWDRPIVWAYQVLYMLTFIVSGLDRRYGWTHLPLAVSLVALVLIVAFFVLVTWAPLVNAHLETYVRIQTARDHRVVDSGPYAIIRHPAYAGLALFFAALPLSLGSLWGLVPGGAAIALLLIRTTLEDRTLQRELPGYAAYAQRVRFRLVPGVW
jgi:protein-S-isoprenylcysteine O-methyltransferase Ste14